KRVRDQQTEKDKSIALLRKRVGECKEAGISAQRAIEKLQELAGVEGPDQLTEIIRVSQRRGDLGTEQAGLEGTLIAEGDGLPLTALRDECAEVDLDQTASREGTLRHELKDLHNHL